MLTPREVVMLSSTLTCVAAAYVAAGKHPRSGVDAEAAEVLARVNTTLDERHGAGTTQKLRIGIADRLIMDSGDEKARA